MILKGITLSYPYILEKNKGTPQNPATNPAYQAVILIDKKHPQVAEVRKAIEDAGAEKFGKLWPKLKAAVAGTDHEPLKDGDKKLDKEGNIASGYEGRYYLKAKSTKVRPKLRNKAKEVVVPTEDTIAELFYGGVTADAEINAFAYEHSGKRSVSFGLIQLRSHERGDAFGGRVASGEDAFDDVAEEDEALT